jgi:hypothetical protein
MVHELRKPGTEQVPPIQYIVEGGHRLAGTIEPSGNKNAALPIIAAAPSKMSRAFAIPKRWLS